MIILIDADSIVYASCFNVDTIDSAKVKLESYIYNICSSIEEIVDYPADKVRIFHGQDGFNFRNKIQPTYKANRNPVKPDFFNELSAYIKFVFESESAPDGLEVDDLIAREWERLTYIGGEDVVIASIDKDFLQLPAKIYSWTGKRKGLKIITEKEAIRNFYTQMITGDSVDNVNYIHGKGIKFAQKYLSGANTSYQHMNRVYRLFKEEYEDSAKNKYRECYSLLKIG